MNCPRHPKVETNLRCGKCDQIICPKCAVQTPVGARCPDCAKFTRLPILQVSPLDYLKILGIGMVLAGVLGAVWGIAAPFVLGFSYLLALPAGYIIGELSSRVVKRKRGIGLQITIGICVGICYGVAVAFGLTPSLYSLLGLAAGIFLAINQFR